MPKIGVSYDETTGKIGGVWTSYPADAIARADQDRQGGLRYVEIDASISAVDIHETMRVSDLTLVLRPVLDLPSTLVLSLGEVASFVVPAGAMLLIDGEEAGTCDDGVLTIAGEMTDTYRLDVRAWPYRDHTMTVTVA